MRITVFLSLLLFLATTAAGQINWERQAASRIEKKQWLKANQLLKRALRKDTASISGHYLYAVYFYQKGNPDHQLDSSLHHLRVAAASYRQMLPRDRERLQRIPLDSTVLEKLEINIDSSAFELAKSINTVTSYEDFVRKHPDAAEKSAALELRDEVAFLETLKKNTAAAFKTYLTEYPASHRRAEALQRYEKLVFESATKDRRLKSFEKFLQDNPQSPYRAEAEAAIFGISTASGSPHDFEAFLRHYPQAASARRAEQLLFFLTRDNKELSLKWSDSLQLWKSRSQSYWLPFYQDGRFGFMDAQGVVQMPARFNDIFEEYKCGPVEDDVLLTSEGLITRLGQMLFRGDSLTAQVVAPGFLLAGSDSVRWLLHKGGWRYEQPVRRARLVADRFLALENMQQRWGLIALNGWVLLPFQYEDIDAIDEVIVLGRGGKKYLYPASSVHATADRVELPAPIVVDEARAWGDSAIHIRNGALEGVINQHLEAIIPMDRQALTFSSFGFLRSKNGQTWVEGIPALSGRALDKVTVREPWLLAEESKQSLLVLLTTKKVLETNADSLWTDGPFAGSRKRDSTRLYLPTRRFSIEATENYHWRKGPDSLVIFIQSGKKGRIVFDEHGNRLFSGNWDDVQPIGHQLLEVVKGTRKGIVNLQGKVVLPADYDAIIVQNGFASLLKDKKFGALRLHDQLLIKPAYERNLVPFGTLGWIAYRDGKCGLLHPDGKPAGKFEFLDMQYWNDTLTWVRLPYGWSLRNNETLETLLERVSSFEVIATPDGDAVIRYEREHFIGVYSIRHGSLLGPTFHEIANTGTLDLPVYRCEKEVEEAGIIVVLFYDKTGKQIRRQLIEQEDYEKITCSEN
ncbi:MAG: hypothetical protein K1X47_06060 [Cyclobacteriaceae bacterium]|nr:hypothetical protein [Cyclobacteriaceae bacterium]